MLTIIRRHLADLGLSRQVRLTPVGPDQVNVEYKGEVSLCDLVQLLRNFSSLRARTCRGHLPNMIRGAKVKGV